MRSLTVRVLSSFLGLAAGAFVVTSDSLHAGQPAMTATSISPPRGASERPQQGDANLRVLEPAAPVERELASDQAHSYTLALTAGQYVHIVVDQRGIDVVVTVFAPDGKKLEEVDSPNGTEGPEPLTFVTQSSGRYRLEVRSPDKAAAAGRYVAKIEELRTATDQDKARMVARQVFVQAETLRVEGTAASLQSASKKYEESLPLYRAAGDQRGEADALGRLGAVYDALGEKQRALDYLTRALPLKRAVGDRDGEGEMLNNMARVYDDLGDKQKALDHYSLALPAIRAAGNRSHEALLLNNIGSVHEDLGDMAKALDFYNQALPLIRAVGNRDGEATLLNNLGRFYNALAERQKALDYHAQALPIFRAAGNRIGEGATFHNIGSIYSSLGEKQKALDYFNQALTIFHAAGDRRKEATSLNSIGFIYDALGEKQKALDSYAQALPLARATGNRSGEAITLSNIGGVYKDLGEKQKSLEHYIQALPLTRAVRDRTGEARTLNNIGTVYDDLRDDQKASEHYTQALSLYRAVGNSAGEAGTLYNVATLEGRRGNLTESLSNIQAALAIVEVLRTRVAGPDLRSSYFATFQKYYEYNIDVLMRLHAQRPSDGYDARALQASENARARSLLETVAEASIDIRQGVDVQLLDRERAVRQQLNAKARQQSALLNGAHTEAQASNIAKELEALTFDYQQTEAAIRSTSPRYAALTQPQPLNLRETQQALDPGTLLLEYSLGADRSYVWAVTPTTMAGFELPKRADIDVLARRYYEQLTARNQHPAGESAQAWRERIATGERERPATAAALSRLILGPVRDLLPGKRLLIAPVGTLQYVPFGALPLPDAAAAEGAPIASRQQVVIVPSLSVVAVQQQNSRVRASPAKTVAVIADPVFDDRDSRLAAGRPATAAAPAASQTASETSRDLERAASATGVNADGGRLPRLRFSRDEASAILALATPAARLRALDFDATVGLVSGSQIANYQILHVASHAFLNGDHPELAGIALSMVDAQGRPIDGFLRLGDIYNLTLPIDLVVLSACQTALGRDLGGEGLVGLTRGFMYAGASRVVGSLWKVDDQATAQLMTLFYQNLLGKARMRPAAALRAAQEAMWRSPRWQSPYYWAAFVLEGDWR